MLKELDFSRVIDPPAVEDVLQYELPSLLTNEYYTLDRHAWTGNTSPTDAVYATHCCRSTFHTAAEGLGVDACDTAVMP